jgi:hypothetical protein
MIKVFVDHVGCKGFLQKATNPYLLTHLKTLTMKRLRTIQTGSVATPLLANLERALVMVEEGSTLPVNPTFQVPLDPLLV